MGNILVKETASDFSSADMGSQNGKTMSKNNEPVVISVGDSVDILEDEKISKKQNKVKSKQANKVGVTRRSDESGDAKKQDKDSVSHGVESSVEVASVPVVSAVQSSVKKSSTKKRAKLNEVKQDLPTKSSKSDADNVGVAVTRGVSGNAVSKTVQSSNLSSHASRLVNASEGVDKKSNRKRNMKASAGSLMVISTRDDETEQISEDADVFATDVKPVQPMRGEGFPSANSKNRARAMHRSMSGMMMDVRPSQTSASKVGDNLQKTPSSSTADEETSEGEPRFSKPKAALIATGVALLVGVVGGFILWLTNKPETQYCLVQFETNGGSEVESNEIVCGNIVNQPEDPSKEGFDFQGWVYAGSPFNFPDTVINEDIILVAKWQVQEGVETVTVKFDSAGGSEVTEQKIAKGKKATAPVGVTRDGYTLTGWYLGDAEFNFATATVNKDITLTAKWERKKEQSSSQNNNSSRPNNNSSSSNSSSNNSSSEKPSTTVTGLAVSDQKVKQGETVRVDVSIAPTTAKYELVASSSNNAVASCVVTGANHLECSALGAGTATITVRDNSSNRSTSFTITVEAGNVSEDPTNPPIMPVEQITISGAPKEMIVGEAVVLTALITPEEATNRNVLWYSDNSNVVSIDRSGYMRANGPGTATITAMAGGESTSVVVIVNEIQVDPEPPVVDPTPPVSGDDDQGDENSENTASM